LVILPDPSGNFSQNAGIKGFPPARLWPIDWNGTVKSDVVGEILGPDLLVILAIVFILFGGSQLPKLARSIGTARREFERGVLDGETATPAPSSAGSSIPPRPDVLSKAEVEEMLYPGTTAPDDPER
jgi:sec-independent protein translocase protein TatA